MLHIIGLVAPIFVVIALGRIAVHRGLLDESGHSALNGFTYWLALPALLFGSIAELDTGRLLDVAGVYLACCIVLYAVAMLAGRVLLNAPLARCAVFGLNATYGNVIFLGTPLVSAVFGQAGLALILAIIAFHSGVLLPLAAVLIEIGAGRQGSIGIVLRKTVFGLLRNPIMMSIALGFLWHGFGRALPAPLHVLLGMIGRAAAPLALFCLGASLPPIASDTTAMREAVLATVLKLTVLPVCVGSAGWMLGISGLPLRVAVVTAAMPTGANAFLLARRATNFAEASASTVVVATALSIFSITFLLAWMH